MESILTNFKNQVRFLKTLKGKLPQGAFPMGYVKIGRLLINIMVLAYIVYTFLLLTMLLFVKPLCIGRNFDVNTTLINKLSYYFPVAVLGLVLGLRYGVGVDYFSYEQMYISQKWYSIFDGNSGEFIFGFIYFVCFRLGLPYAFVQILLNCIFFIFFYKTFESKKTIFPWVVIFLFLTGFLFLYLNIQRQGIAFSILLYALKFVESRNFIKYLLCIMFAMGFHLSSLLFLPVYFIFPLLKIINSVKFQLLLWILSFVFSSIILQSIGELTINLLEMTKYGRYGAAVFTDEMERGSGMGLIVKGISDFVIILYSKYLLCYYRDDNYFKASYLVFFIGILLSNIFQYNLLLSRVAFIFVSFRMVVLAYAYNCLFHIKVPFGKTVSIFLIAIYLAYYIGMIYVGNNSCSPYHFISF